MITRRSIVLFVLIAVPVAVYLVLGGYAIIQSGRFSWFWWLAPLSGLTALVLSRLWPRTPPVKRTRQQLVGATHWTARDREAATIVRQHQETVEQYTATQLTDPHFYVQQVQELANQLARHYHPKAKDPFHSLTVPEVLAAIRLAVDDMERWMLTSVPGSRLLTIGQWQMLQWAPTWFRRIQNAAWAASILINPVNVARFFSSRLTYDPITEELQDEILAVVYLRFIRQVGYYLIEMNSGRLRGGADAYRATFDAAYRDLRHAELGDPEPPPITIALVGQVSSGKSSLVNRLTGGREAAVDILPETQQVQQYKFTLGDPPVSVTLLDTPGYGESGATKQQVKQIRQALEESNAALLVMDAHSPAREADRLTLQHLREAYASRPKLKPPPVLGVLTHVDLLQPPLEWSPPYTWRTPSGPKERSIHDAVAYVADLFPEALVDVVPVCAGPQPERTWGILEELVPALTNVLSEAQSVAILRAFEQQLDRDRWTLLLKQVGRIGRDALHSWIDERLTPGPPPRRPPQS